MNKQGVAVKITVNKIAGAAVKVTFGKAPTVKVSRANGGIKIQWKKNKNAKNYIVYRSVKKDSGYEKIAKVKMARTYYVDKKAKSKKNYYYKVVVVEKKKVNLMSKDSKKIKK